MSSGCKFAIILITIAVLLALYIALAPEKHFSDEISFEAGRGDVVEVFSQETVHVVGESQEYFRISDGKIYMVTSQRSIFIFDATNNGTKIAIATTPSSSWSSPTIANGRLYIGCNDWNVYSFSNDVTSQESTSTPSNNVNFEFNFVAVAVAIAASLIVAVVAFGYLLRKRVKK